MEAKNEKFLALFLVFSLLVMSCTTIHPIGKKRTVEDSSKQRRGAKLVIEKKDGQQLRGELIAVKQASLLLLDSESGADVTVDISDVKVTKIVKKSKFWKGAGYGLLIGIGIGALVGVAVLDQPGQEFTAEGWAVIGGSIGGGIGVLIGAIVGAAKSGVKTIQIEGKSDSEIKEILEKLRKEARVPDYQ